MFTSPLDQIKQVRAWNKKYNWGFSAADFKRVEASIPKVPTEELVALVLVPYLKNVENTFQELWTRASAEQDANWCWGGYDKAGSERLRLLNGIEHKSGLRWEVIDLGCERNKKPMDVRSAKSSPHAGILAAAALHPQWVKSMDGDKVPYVWIPGYKVQVPGDGDWQLVPVVGFGRGDRRVRLGARGCSDDSSVYAVPALREVLDTGSLGTSLVGNLDLGTSEEKELWRGMMLAGHGYDKADKAVLSWRERTKKK